MRTTGRRQRRRWCFDCLLNAASIMAGAPGADALHRDGAAALRADFRGHLPQQGFQPGDHVGFSSRIWNSISAPPGMMLGAPDPA